MEKVAVVSVKDHQKRVSQFLQAEGRRFEPVNSHTDNQAVKKNILTAFLFCDQKCDHIMVQEKITRNK